MSKIYKAYLDEILYPRISYSEVAMGLRSLSKCKAVAKALADPLFIHFVKLAHWGYNSHWIKEVSNFAAVIYANEVDLKSRNRLTFKELTESYGTLFGEPGQRRVRNTIMLIINTWDKSREGLRPNKIVRSNEATYELVIRWINELNMLISSDKYDAEEFAKMLEKESKI